MSRAERCDRDLKPAEAINHGPFAMRHIGSREPGVGKVRNPAGEIHAAILGSEHRQQTVFLLRDGEHLAQSDDNARQRAGNRKCRDRFRVPTASPPMAGKPQLQNRANCSRFKPGVTINRMGFGMTAVIHCHQYGWGLAAQQKGDGGGARRIALQGFHHGAPQGGGSYSASSLMS